MLGRSLVVMIGMLALIMSGGARAAQSDDSFTLSVGAANCDLNPFETQDATCTPVAGTVVIVTLESGAFVGSCTLETFPTPYGGVASGCGIDGVPFNSTLIIYEDESTITPGYVPVNSPQTFQTTDLIPGGGDGPVISFVNVLAADPPTETSSGTAADPPVVEAAPQPGGRTTAIHEGTCTALGDPTVMLPDIVDPQGPPVGQPSAIEAATSSTTAAVSLDYIIDQPHAVVVLASNAPDAGVIACGDIGGVDNDDGELIIGLHEVNGSGYTGIAYLAYAPSDGSQTTVSVFLVAGLSGSA